MLIATKPNAPNLLCQFDRATVNRPLMRARLGARRGAELWAHHLHHLFFVASFAPMRLFTQLVGLEMGGNVNRTNLLLAASLFGSAAIASFMWG